MKNIKISAFIIAKNEETRIALAINSLKKIADEIIVVDSGSLDNTVNIAQSLGAHTIFNEWPGYVKQKLFAEKQCRNDWIINIDADEELSLEAQEEIEKLICNLDKYYACSSYVVIIHRNDRLPRKFAPSNKCIRLYNKKFCSFANVDTMSTHDAVKFNNNLNYQGKIYSLKKIIYHRSGQSIEQLVAKANFYSSQQAQDMLNLNRRPTKIRIFFEFFTSFLKIFFIRRYFIFGFDGFIDSVIFAFTKFMRLAKTRELTNELYKSKEL